MTDTPLTPSQIAEQQSQAVHEAYLQRVVVALDQFANVAFGGLPDETISSHVRRLSDSPDARHHVIARILNDALNLVQANHGADAESGDLERAQAVVKAEEAGLKEPEP